MKTREQDLKRVEELDKIIEKGVNKCETWKTSSDGSHGACLDYAGVFKARKERDEILQGLVFNG